MSFLHTRRGTTYQGAQPGPLTAAAEFAELMILGLATVHDRQIVVREPAQGDREWIYPLTAGLVVEPMYLAVWLRAHHQALATQQALASARGVLIPRGRARLGTAKDRYDVEPRTRNELTNAMVAAGAAPGTPTDPRLPALARLLVSARLDRRAGFSNEQARMVTRLAARSTIPVPAEVLKYEAIGLNSPL